MNLHQLLVDRARNENPVRVGLIGVGKFGSMYLAQARTTPGIQIVGVADLAVEKTTNTLTMLGWSPEQLVHTNTASRINDVAATGRTAIAGNALELIDADLDVMVESTGSPEAGAQHALLSIDRGQHVVMVTVEADALVGPMLRRQAERAGVAYSFAYGDQPALVCELVDWARTCNLEVVAAGKGTRHLPHYHYSTPDTVFESYGIDKELESDLNAKMFNSFLDGTKSAIEMAVVSNATGLAPQAEGLSFPPVGVEQLPEVLKPRSEGGILDRSGTVEVVSSLRKDGSPVPGDLRWGVYVVFHAASDYLQKCLRQYGVQTDRSGRYASLYRPYHLVGLELGISVAWAVLRNTPTGASQQLVADVASCAKRDLNQGEQLDGEGGFTVYGKLMPVADSLRSRSLPIGLAGGARLARSIQRDRILTYEDVTLPSGSPLLSLRRQLEEEARRGQKLPAGGGNRGDNS